MKKFVNLCLLVLFISGVTISFTGCEESKLENAAEQVDEAVEEVDDEIDDATTE